MERKNFAAGALREILTQVRSENFLLKSDLEKTRCKLEKTKRELEHANGVISKIKDFVNGGTW